MIYKLGTLFHCIVNMMGGYPACLKFSFHHSMHIRRLLDHFLFEHGYFFPQVWRFVLTRTIDNSLKVDTLKNTAKRFDSAMELSTAGTETNFCSTSKENAQRILRRIQAVVPSSLWKVQFSFSSEKSKHSPTTTNQPSKQLLYKASSSLIFFKRVFVGNWKVACTHSQLDHVPKSSGSVQSPWARVSWRSCLIRVFSLTCLSGSLFDSLFHFSDVPCHVWHPPPTKRQRTAFHDVWAQQVGCFYLRSLLWCNNGGFSRKALFSKIRHQCLRFGYAIRANDSLIVAVWL